MDLTKKNFKNLYVESFQILYKAYIHPNLEYCVQVWSPYLRKDTVVRESTEEINDTSAGL